MSAYDPGVSVHDQPVPAASSLPQGGGEHRLGYLLKHAQARFTRLITVALEPLGISSREWAALLCLDEQHGHSQKEVADLLGIDRTTMVALVDELQASGLVKRHPQPDDRRKNIVTLTRKGREIMERGAVLIDDCERQFLAVLSKTDAEQLKNALNTVIAANQ
jgi:DNA-binding MarR family transcriptional regulator